MKDRRKYMKGDRQTRGHVFKMTLLMIASFVMDVVKA